MGRAGKFRHRGELSRYKDDLFVRCLIKRIGQGGGLDPETLTEAALDAFGFGCMTDEAARKAALRRAQRLLRNPDVQARFAGLFDIGEFTVVDAVRSHIAHIREGNYQALKDYWAMTQGPLVKRVSIASVSQTKTTYAFEGNEAGAHQASIGARILGPAQVGEEPGGE